MDDYYINFKRVPSSSNHLLSYQKIFISKKLAPYRRSESNNEVSFRLETAYENNKDFIEILLNSINATTPKVLVKMIIHSLETDYERLFEFTDFPESFYSDVYKIIKDTFISEHHIAAFYEGYFN